MSDWQILGMGMGMGMGMRMNFGLRKLVVASALQQGRKQLPDED